MVQNLYTEEKADLKIRIDCMRPTKTEPLARLQRSNALICSYTTKIICDNQECIQLKHNLFRCYSQTLRFLVFTAKIFIRNTSFTSCLQLNRKKKVELISDVCRTSPVWLKTYEQQQYFHVTQVSQKHTLALKTLWFNLRSNVKSHQQSFTSAEIGYKTLTSSKSYRF